MENALNIVTSIGKNCTKCGAYKPLSEYYDDKRVKRDGKLAHCKKCYLERASKYQKNLPEERKEARRQKYSVGEYARNANFKKKYGITLEDVRQMYRNQMGLCDNRGCGQVLDLEHRGVHRTKAVVDHCHTTGKVRGLLCFKCNTTLGLLEDKNVVMGLVDYLKKYDQFLPLTKETE